MGTPSTEKRNDITERILYVLNHFWGGNQRAMSEAIGVSQAAISLIANRHRPPGRRVIEAIARYPGIDREWLLTGGGQPLRTEEAGSLPITEVILPGPPLRHPHLLRGGRHPVAAEYARQSRYWLAVGPHSPLLREPRLRLAPGDLMLLEASTEWTGRPDLTAGKICGVRIGAIPHERYVMGGVWHDGDRLKVSLIGDRSVTAPQPDDPSRPPETPTRPRRPIRKIRARDNDDQQSRPERAQTEESARPEREVARQAAQREKVAAEERAAGVLEIASQDIVAVLVYTVRPQLSLDPPAGY